MKKKLTMLFASLFLVLGTAWAQISTLGDLDNSTAYLLKNANDMGYAIWKDGDNLTLCGASSKYTDALDATAGGSNWQIIKYENAYYLYNVGAARFAVTQRGATYLTETPTAINIESVSKGFAFNSSSDDLTYMCASHQGHHASAPVQWWSANDNGSAWQIIESPATESLQTLLVGADKVEEHFSTQVKLTIQYKFTGTEEILYTTEVMAIKGGQYTVKAPDFTSVASVTISGTIEAETFTVPNTATTITVALNNEFPYETTTIVDGEFPADAAWYVMNQNSTQNDTKIWKYADGLSTEKVSEYSDNHLWCFVGNPFDLKIYSKVAGASKSLSSSTQPASMTENATGWVVVKSDKEQTFAGKNPFCLQRKNVSGSYLNGYSFGYWTAKDGGSTIKGDRAYSLTVKYMFQGEELTERRIEKVVISGTEYTVDVTDLGEMIVQSVEGATQDEAGKWVVTVNAATTVTVTLKEDVFVSGNGSRGSISVADINDQSLNEIPAGAPWTISIEVKNPNGVSFNDWGTSIFAIGNNAFPEKNGYRGLQFYLQSSTNGGKLDAVFDGGDHLIDNVTYTGNFTATISYDGENQLQIKTTNASGKVAVNDFTLNNKLAEFSQFAYGLPTGINIKSMHIDRWINQIDCPTSATTTNGKMYFTSQKFTHINNYNRLRFTLTESGAYYKNGKNRLSFDSFELFDAQGNKVELKESYFAGNYNKSYAGLLDGINAGKEGAGCCCGAWGSADEGDDYFEITLPNDVDLGGAFSFSFVTENTTMNAKRFTIDLSYVETEVIEYAFSIINAPESETVEVTYNNEAIDNGGTIVGEVDTKLFAVTNIPGYTWSIEVDEENRTVTLTFTKIKPVENPEAVVALVNRIGGAGTANKFKFVFDPSINSEQETFVIGAEDGKILIKGSTLSALTTGLGWYLNNIAHINIAWNSLNEKTVAVKNEGTAYADLSYLPLPTAEETHTSDAKYRYYLNTCTFGYSMTSWTWTRWQQEIDWMALHGINMPLQLVGLEEVWRTFLTMKDANGNRKYGYSDEEAKAFVAGPAFIAWWAMNNLEGWGGTAAGSKSGYNNLAGAGGVQDDAWYARQKKLAKQIVDAQRGLGMQPVIPGWSGMVPTNFKSKSGFETRGNGGNWAGDFVRPLLLNVNIGADKYAEIAADYYECLHAVMGESQYYSMDPFHEGGGAGTMEDYEALYAAMEAANKGSQWVIQQWQWSATQAYSLTAVPAGRLIVLDLFSDGSPAFDKYTGYAPQEAVFCAIPNFGGRSGLMGRLQNVTDNYFKFKTKYASIKGIGTAPEAIEQTPVTYDLIYQLPWMNGVKPNVAEWVDNYAVARYGKDNSVVKEAWSLLRQGPLAYGADGIQGPVEDVWAARPNLNANKASSWGKTLADAGGTYTPARRQMLIDAVYKLIDQEDELELTNGSVYKSNYLYDLVEFGGAVMADYAYDLLLGIKAAKNAEGTSGATYKARRDAFLQLILDMDAFRGTNLNFRLGKWTQEARDAAREVENATTATPDWYEYNNARTILTTWSSPGTNLTDYSYRSWQGLLKDYYYPRWKYYFDNNCTNGEYKFFEWNWAHGMTHKVGDSGISTTPLQKGDAGHTDSYTREPEGNTVEKAVEMLGKYIIPVTVNGNTHYAYRYLDNDVSNMATIPANAGGTVDLTPYFGELTGIQSFTSEVVEGTVTDLSKVAIKANAADGAHSATITLEDGTKLTFYFSMNPKFNGVYTINYKNGNDYAPVFIGYNEDKDNANNVGYKLIATGTYSTTAVGDKYFTIIPSGAGFNLSAQGKYLKAPNLSAWNHVMFSDNQSEAGVYLFEAEADLYKMRNPSNADDIKYINDYDNLVFGNDKAGKGDLATFTITEAETFPFTVSAAGMATLCLPFNVVMAEGMYAYDLARTNIEAEEDEEEDKYVCTMKAVAAPGDTLKKGTPVIIQAEQGAYNLAITMDDTDAKGALEGSLLKGNFVSQALTQSKTTPKFIFAKVGEDVGFFFLTDGTSFIGANKCWLEWDMTLGQVANSISLRFDDGSTDVEHIETSRPTELIIYNILGQRLDAPQKGINIINGKKVLIK